MMHTPYVIIDSFPWKDGVPSEVFIASVAKELRVPREIVAENWISLAEETDQIHHELTMRKRFERVWEDRFQYHMPVILTAKDATLAPVIWLAIRLTILCENTPLTVTVGRNEEFFIYGTKATVSV